MEGLSENNFFKPDPTLKVVKGFLLKGPYLNSPNEDLSMDMKDGRKYECPG